MTQLISDSAIVNATGRDFDYWKAFLEKRGALSKSHKEIALLLREEGGVPPWWTQQLTVMFEQHIGRRVPGQDCDGEFSVSASKTITGSMDDALRWWVDRVGDQSEFSDIPISRGPDISRTDKWRYWRVGLADGSRVNVNIYEKSADKASLGIQHEKLESTDQVEHWRAFWKNFLKG